MGIGKFTRQIALPFVGVAGQNKIKNKSRDCGCRGPWA